MTVKYLLQILGSTKDKGMKVPRDHHEHESNELTNEFNLMKDPKPQM